MTRLFPCMLMIVGYINPQYFRTVKFSDKYRVRKFYRLKFIQSITFIAIILHRNLMRHLPRWYYLLTKAPFTRARVGSQPGVARFAIRKFFCAYTNPGWLLSQLLNPARVSLLVCLTRVGYRARVHAWRDLSGEGLTLCGGLEPTRARVNRPQEMFIILEQDVILFNSNIRRHETEISKKFEK